MAISEKSGDFGALCFSQKPLYELCWIFCCCQVAKNHPKTKMLVMYDMIEKTLICQCHSSFQ
jgi:hypothetical protein